MDGEDRSSLERLPCPQTENFLPVESRAKMMEVLSLKVETPVVDASRGSVWLWQRGNTLCAHLQPRAPCNEAEFLYVD